MAFCGVVVKNLYDVGMTQPGYDLGLPLETRLKFRICFYKVMHDLDCHGAVQREMSAQIYLCHSTLGDSSLDAYLANCLTNPIRHGRIIQPEYSALLFEMLRKRRL